MNLNGKGFEMISPGWAAFGLSVLIAVCGVAASWAVVQYKINTTDKALASLESAIRDVGKEIKGLLFNASDAGRPFYRRVDDCEKVYTDLDERVTSLEDKAHSHEGQRVPS